MKKSKKSTAKKMNNQEQADPLDRDLSEWMLDGIRNNKWQVVQFEMREPKDKVISLRISQKLLDEVKLRAKSMGLDTQKFIRITLENSIRKKVG